MKNLIFMPNDVTLGDVIKQLVASANSREEITISVKKDEYTSYINKLNTSLLEFGEPVLLNYLTINEYDGVLNITLKSWDGPLLFEDEHIFYLRNDTRISLLHLEKEKNLDRCFTPVIISRL